MASETKSNKNKAHLFLCHQMAMKREADDRNRTDILNRQLSSSCIDVPIMWVLGGPGSGKGTQCAKIVQKYHFVHLSTGDLLRAEVAAGTPKGLNLANLMKEGKLVPNEDVLHLLENALNANLKDAPGFLIDGYPREKDQGMAFEKKIGPADLILFFDCTDETLVQRILKRAATADEKRADDTEEAVRTRIATFRSNTNGILSQYTDKTLTINAERSVDEIFCDVSCAIDCLIKRKAEGLAKTN